MDLIDLVELMTAGLTDWPKNILKMLEHLTFGHSYLSINIVMISKPVRNSEGKGWIDASLQWDQYNQWQCGASPVREVFIIITMINEGGGYYSRF